MIIQYSLELSGVNKTVLRFPNLYGVNQKSGQLLPTILNKISAGELKISLNSLDGNRNYLHVEDATDAILKFLKSPLNANSLCISGENVEITYILENIKKMFNKLTGKNLNFFEKKIVNKRSLYLVPPPVLDDQISRKTYNWQPQKKLNKGFWNFYATELVMQNNEIKLKELIKLELNSRKEGNKGTFSHSVGWPLYDERELYAALDSLLDLSLSQGRRVREFEQAYKNYLGLPEKSSAVAVNSGSSANLVAFASLIDTGKLKVGDEVIVPAATFATVSSILYQLGLIPVYVDSEMETWNMDPVQVRNSITKKTKAVMVVHNLGFPAKMDEIMDVANECNLIVVEDCCSYMVATIRVNRLDQ